MWVVKREGGYLALVNPYGGLWLRYQGVAMRMTSRMAAESRARQFGGRVVRLVKAKR